MSTITRKGSLCGIRTPLAKVRTWQCRQARLVLNLNLILSLNLNLPGPSLPRHREFGKPCFDNPFLRGYNGSVQAGCRGVADVFGR